MLGVSTDSHFSHLAWINSPRKQGGLGGLNYPLVSDFNKTISRDYGVLIEEAGIALREIRLLESFYSAILVLSGQSKDAQWNKSVLSLIYKLELYLCMTFLFTIVDIFTQTQCPFQRVLIVTRGLFIIDPQGVVRQMSINDLPVGRSVDETLR